MLGYNDYKIQWSLMFTPVQSLGLQQLHIQADKSVVLETQIRLSRCYHLQEFYEMNNLG